MLEQEQVGQVSENKKLEKIYQTVFGEPKKLEAKIAQIDNDYKEVKNKILEVIWERQELHSCIRCHEMARLICSGMKEKGYNAAVEDGIYREFYPKQYLAKIWKKLKSSPSEFDNDYTTRGPCFATYHSWVNIDGVILDYHFEKNTPLMCFTNFSRTVQDKSEKQKYRKCKIKFQLYEKINELAEKIFPPKQN